MAKVTIVIEDEAIEDENLEDQVHVSVEFDPPLDKHQNGKDWPLSPAQATAIEMMDSVTKANGAKFGPTPSDA